MLQMQQKDQFTSNGTGIEKNKSSNNFGLKVIEKFVLKKMFFLDKPVVFFKIFKYLTAEALSKQSLNLLLKKALSLTLCYS